MFRRNGVRAGCINERLASYRYPHRLRYQNTKAPTVLGLLTKTFSSICSLDEFRSQLTLEGGDHRMLIGG